MKINEIKEYIKTKLEKIIRDFPEIRFRYEYKDDSNIHFIEITPNEIYHSNKNYIKYENDFTYEFIYKFPNHNVCFISDDSIIGIKNAEFEIKGKNFIKNNFENITINNYKLNINIVKDEVEYDTHMKEFDKINTTNNNNINIINPDSNKLINLLAKDEHNKNFIIDEKLMVA